MNKVYNEKLINNSRELRKNMTNEEKHLWYDFLKDLDITVHRQKVIFNYIVDFYIPSCKIVIEIDGSQHYEEENRKNDIERDFKLRSEGIRVLRYTNLQIKREFKNVCRDILNNITPHPSASQTPSPQGEG